MSSRRSVFTGLAALGMAPSVTWGAMGSPAILSAARARDGSFQLVGLTAAAEIGFRVTLPARGHAAAAHPHLAEAVAIARRPGTYALVIDCATGQVRQTLTAPPDRHFYGHGAFSAEGDLLFTTENAISTGEGRIGVWDRSLGYVRVDEFPSAGIGPHEILRLPNGDLAVANGGIRTHPKTGRAKLNLDRMRASLAVFSPMGHLKDRAEVPEVHRLNSLRHIAAADAGRIVCGFQWHGDPFAAPALVSLYDGTSDLAPAQFEAASLRGLDGYIGSVGAMADGGFAATSPRGGRVLVFDPDGVQTESFRAQDVCGLVPVQGEGALVTDGSGRVHRLSEAGLHMLRSHDLAFDNHLVSLA